MLGRDFNPQNALRFRDTAIRCPQQSGQDDNFFFTETLSIAKHSHFWRTKAGPID